MRVVTTKKTGEKMAFFTLITRDSEVVPCVAFPRDYTLMGDILEENSIITVSGEISLDKNDEKQLVVSSGSKMREISSVLAVEAKNLLEVASIAKLADGCRGNEFYLEIINRGADVSGENSTRRLSFPVSSNIKDYLERDGLSYIVA